VIVNQITADQLAQTAILSLIVALLSVLAVVAIAYRITEGSASLGVITIVPVAFTLTWVLGTMALLDIPFNIVTGMITGLTIGLGVDYSLHVSERFNQELEDAETVAVALHETITGTGGALLSSAATTASGFAVLLVAILPFLQSFGLITALTIVFAFLASVFVLPSLLVVWARLTDHSEDPDAKHSRDADVSDTPTRTEPTVTRTLDPSYVLPDESVSVTVLLQGLNGRVSLQESAPSEFDTLEVEPEPVATNRCDGTVTVYWDIEEPTRDATVSYTVDLPSESSDGLELAFDGRVESADGQYAIGGGEAAVVVDDVFQRVLERGEVTDADIEAAVGREGVTGAEFDRLRRAWLEED
jgi:hypothetical protein